MNPDYTLDALPTELVEYIERAGEASRFRRRAVLTNGNGKWELRCCTVEWFFCDEEMPSAASTHQYEKAVLYEDVLSERQCLEFVTELSKGIAQFGDYRLKREAPPQWITQIVPFNNAPMGGQIPPPVGTSKSPT
ncbi:hypothetical protein [Paraburkholderia tagetis]|uniref:Uncharacterized protein n=1 Tax=Paraburkholderia tagetis TaxID=2913261 RepID=A0A9X1UP39_9BURK|nr:hypothetical protein [Paraburkholderia tagetis]MCG5079065.1 hypothetical protein [Paraburkholderia tagetis]